CALVNSYSRLAVSLARSRRGKHLLEDTTRDWRIFVEMSHQPVVHGRVHDPVDLRVDELHLGLRFKARIRQLNAENGNQSLAHVVSGNGRVFVLKKAVLLRVLIDCSCERSAESS